MLYTILPYGESEAYVSSDGVDGVIAGVGQNVVVNDQSGRLNILGVGEVQGKKIVRVPSLLLSKQRKKELGVVKSWSLVENISYFLPDEKYESTFKGMSEPHAVVFDIEVGSKRGERMDVGTHPIIMIGAKKVGEEKTHIFCGETEKDTIEQFLDYIVDVDPKIVAGYYSKDFDSPYIISRAQQLGVDLARLHRVKPADFIPDPRRESNEYPWELVTLGYGRVHYDIFTSVKLDAYASTRTKNKTLKTIAEFYGSETVVDLPVEVKMNMIEFFEKEPDKLVEYLESDVYQTEYLFNKYYQQVQWFAYTARVSVDAIVNSPGRAPFPKYFLSRTFVKHGVYPVVKNIDRNKYIFEELTNKGKFRGAYVGIKRTGRFRNIAKVDFSAMYPNIIVTFNISPDTVRMVDSYPLRIPEDYTLGEFDQKVVDNGYFPILVHRCDEKILDISIPDETEHVNKYIRFTIDRSKVGIIPATISEIMNKRKAIKKEMKKYPKDSKEYKELDSEQGNVKVAANAVFGIMGNGHFEVGDISCAMLITAFGRDISHFVTGSLGEDVVEIDTDGMYVDIESIDIEQLNSYLDRSIRSKYKYFPIDQTMSLDLEKQGQYGLFLAMKNYILYDPETGKMEVSGSSMKGSSKARVVEDAVKLAAKLIFEWKSPEHIKEAIRNYVLSPDRKPEEFKMNLLITKDELDYKSTGGLVALARDTDKSVKLSELKQMIENTLRTTLSRDKWLDEQTIEAAIQEWRNIVSENKISNRQALISEAISIVQTMSKSSISGEPSGPIKLLRLARKAKITAMVGESIEYYHALCPDKLALFTPSNLDKYAVDKMKYLELVDNIVAEMLTCIEEEQVAELF